MKKAIIIWIITLLVWPGLVVELVYSQSPASFNYQAVARDATGNLMTNQSIDVKFIIKETSAAGPVVFEENHNVMTNQYGLFNLVIGNGTNISGSIAGINWDSNQHFLRVDIDAGGGFINLGTEQLHSTPYSMYSDKAGIAVNMNLTDLNDVNQSAPSNGNVLKWNGTKWAAANDNVNDADNDPANELQSISLSGNNLALSGTNSVSLAQYNNVWSLNGTDAYYNSGDVGIGTTNPGGKLEIFQNSSLTNPHLTLNENGNDYARFNFQNSNAGNYWSIAGYVGTLVKNDRLNFWNGATGDIMTITGDGRVGIGVGISPKTSLHVADNTRVLFGADTLGAGDKLMWLPDLHAFRVGSVATGSTSTYWNRDSIGLYSFASGLNTRAQGYGATAMGRDTEASNSYAFASGFFSNADGQYSTAMGFNTDAIALGSTALGYSTDAEANYSFAAGYFAEAQAIYSAAIGNAVWAQSYSSMAIGRYNVGGGSATSWVATDPIFEIGIGSGPSTRVNAMTVAKNGNVGIGTIFPGANLHVIGIVRIGSLEEFSDGGSFLIDVNSSFGPSTNGNRTLGTSTNRWSTVYATNGTINTSDIREKNNISDLQYGLSDVMKLRPVSYQWIAHPEQGTKIGLIAQELIEVVSEVVVDKEYITNEETGKVEIKKADRLGVYYSDLIPVLIKAIQEQQEEIIVLKNKLEIIELKVK